MNNSDGGMKYWEPSLFRTCTEVPGRYPTSSFKQLLKGACSMKTDEIDIRSFPDSDEDLERVVEAISDRLFELFLADPLAFKAFVMYCYAPHINKLKKNVLDLLYEKGLIRANYTIPTIIRRVVLHSTALF